MLARSLVSLAAISVLLLFLVAAFRGKVGDILTNELETQLSRLTVQKSHEVETRLQVFTGRLEAYANLLSESDLNEADVYRVLQRDRSFSRIGFLPLMGRATMGDELDRRLYPAILEAFRGYSSCDTLPGMPGSLMFAVPVYTHRNVSSVLYAVMDPAQVRRQLGANDEEFSICISDTSLKVIVPVRLDASAFRMQDSISQGRTGRSSAYAAYYRKLRDGIDAHDVAVARGPSGKGDLQYVACARLTDQWLVVMQLPAGFVAQRVSTVMHLLLLVLGALFLLIILIFGYLQSSEVHNRKRMYTLAYVDALTGLKNWAWLTDYGHDLIGRREDGLLVILKMRDLRIVNELFGYRGGDEILRKVADVLREHAAEFLCYGKNEVGTFVVVLKNRPDEEARDFVLKFCEKLCSRVTVDKMNVSFQGGLVRLSSCGWNFSSAVDRAKFVMSRLPRSSDSQVAIYDNQVNETLIWNNHIKSELPTALENGDFLVYLQPKVDISSETLVGAEALIRWNYQGKGILAPYRFIPVFEEDGSIAKLDRFVFRSVCAKFCEWRDAGLPLLPISVNLSRVQLGSDQLTQELIGIARQYDVPTSLIDIELTESASFGNMKRLLQVMNALKQGGFKLSMDDFGTGYSSLSLLKDMPLDTLKLDKSFVDALDSENLEARENVVVREIVTLSRALHIHCLAEGVEEKRQRDLLAVYGCDSIQGYYYSKPVPVSKYEEFLHGKSIRKN